MVFTNPTPRLQGGIGVSYDTVVTQCGKGMEFNDPSPQSAGSMRYFGQADRGMASTMVMGNASDLAYATLTVRLPAEAQRAMCDGTEGQLPPAIAELAKQSMDRIGNFVDVTCPDWIDGRGNVLQQIRTCTSGEFNTEIPLGQKVVTITLRQGSFRIAVMAGGPRQE